MIGPVIGDHGSKDTQLGNHSWHFKWELRGASFLRDDEPLLSLWPSYRVRAEDSSRKVLRTQAIAAVREDEEDEGQGRRFGETNPRGLVARSTG